MKRRCFLYLSCLLGLTSFSNSIQSKETNALLGKKSILFLLAPMADAGSNASICLGDSIEIGGNPTGPSGATYQWSNSASLSDENSANPKAAPQVTTTYTVTVTDATSLTATSQITITVDTLPNIDAGVDELICEGTSVQLGGSPTTSATNASYKWDNASSLNFDTLSNPTASPITATNYTLTVTDQNGCSNTDLIKITIRKKPKVNPGADRILCNGGTVLLGGLPTGPFYSNYVWDNAATLSDEFLSNPTARPTVTTTYTVTVTHTGIINCSNTGQVTIYVDTVPSIDAGIDTTICAGSPVQLGGNPTFPIAGGTYKWSNSSSLDNRTLANPIARPLSSTNYQVTFTDGNTACTKTGQVSITVDTVPIADAGIDRGVCSGVASIIGGNSAGVSYAWDNSATLNDTSLSNPTATTDTATTYTLTVTSASNCTATDQVTVYVDSLPSIDAGVDKRICEGSSISIGSVNSGSPGFSYLWNNAASLDEDTLLTPTASPTVTTSYILTVTNGYACSATDTMVVVVDPYPQIQAGADQNVCLGSSIQLGGSPTTMPAHRVSWFPSNGLNDSTFFNPMASPQTTTTYTLTVTDTTTLCTISEQVTITVDSVPTADAGADSTICEADTASIGSSLMAGIQYKWDNVSSLSDDTLPNPIAYPTVTTNYRLVVTNLVGCHDTDFVTVNVNPLPTVNAGSNKTICYEDTVYIGGNPTSINVGDTYLWNNSTSIDNQTAANPKAFPSDSSLYFVTVTSAFGCVAARDSIFVHVNPRPQVSFSANSFCEGLNTNFIDNSTISEGSILNWAWDFDDGVGTSFSQDPSYKYLSSGTYDVLLEVTSQIGCVDSVRQSIVINPKPLADAGPDKVICLTDQTQLGGSPTSNVGSIFNWAPSSSLSSTDVANPFATPISTTKYRLSVTDQKGCKNYDTVEVKVNALPKVVASNDQSVCVNQAVQLTVSGADVYKWTPATWLDNSAISNPVATAQKNIEYRVVGTDTNGCVERDTVLIEVFNVDFLFSDTSICYGTAAQLRPIIEGDENGISYQWSPAESLSSDVIKNPIATPLLDQLYQLTLRNSFGCEDTDSLRVLIKPRAGLAFDYINSPQCIGARVEVTNKTTNSNQFEWFLNEQLRSTDKNPSFEVDNSIENTLTLVGYVNGCSDSLTKTIPIADFIKYLDFDKPNVFSPNGDGVNDNFDPIFQLRGRPLGCIGFKHFQVFNRWGKLVFETTREDETWDGLNQADAAVKEGTYYYVVQVSGKVFKGSVFLSR